MLATGYDKKDRRDLDRMVSTFGSLTGKGSPITIFYNPIATTFKVPDSLNRGRTAAGSGNSSTTRSVKTNVSLPDEEGSC